MVGLVLDSEVAAAGQTISPDLRYMRQYVGNACGTIATIHSLANNVEANGVHPM